MAQEYVSVFEHAHHENETRRRPVFAASTSLLQPLQLPEFKLKHLRAMTDDTGLLQSIAVKLSEMAYTIMGVAAIRVGNRRLEPHGRKREDRKDPACCYR